MSPVDHPLIRAKEAEIEARRRELDLLEAELRGMRTLLEHRQKDAVRVVGGGLSGSAAQPRAAGSVSFHKGRQPGAISKPWRLILSDLYWGDYPHGMLGATYSEHKLVLVANRHGIHIRPSEGRRQMIHYEALEYVGAVPDGWRVSIKAAERFGFDKEPLKNEAPDTEAPGPHESVGEADQTGAD